MSVWILWDSLTVIVSPETLGITLLIVLAGSGILTLVMRKKYGWTPERERDLEEGEFPNRKKKKGWFRK